MNLKLINKLPISIIINEIEPFTRITIPKDLCNDIKNYKPSLVFIYKRCCNSLLETLSITFAVVNLIGLRVLLLMKQSLMLGAK